METDSDHVGIHFFAVADRGKILRSIYQAFPETKACNVEDLFPRGTHNDRIGLAFNKNGKGLFSNQILFASPMGVPFILE
jgi:hypothetical protein